MCAHALCIGNKSLLQLFFKHIKNRWVLSFDGAKLVAHPSVIIKSVSHDKRLLERVIVDCVRDVS